MSTPQPQVGADAVAAPIAAEAGVATNMPVPRTSAAMPGAVMPGAASPDTGAAEEGSMISPPGARPLRVAMVGQKGVPATYGGVEHHVEHLGRLLAEREDLEVTVYCRRSYGHRAGSRYHGMRLVDTPAWGGKHLDTISHSFTSTVHALFSGADIVHYHALGPGLVAPLVRYLTRRRVVLTVHGLDHQRAKWRGPATSVLGLAYRMSGRVPHRVVTVSRALAERYRADFGCAPAYVPNGVPTPVPAPLPERLRTEYGLEPGRYVLFVGRVVPEKRPDLLIQAARSLPDDVKVVIVGGSAFTEDYLAELVALAGADPRIVLPGFLYGDELAGVYQHAAVFVQPSDLEGLPLTLLEAVSHGIPVLASDIDPHREVLAPCRSGAHRTFPRGNLAALTTALAAMWSDRERLREFAVHEAPDLVAPYQWPAAADAVAAVYHSVARDRATQNLTLRGRGRRRPGVSSPAPSPPRRTLS
ncbi:MAG: glycosyltransferase family 4 protein [Dermatophilaceae bacterium]